MSLRIADMLTRTTVTSASTRANPSSNPSGGITCSLTLRHSYGRLPCGASTSACTLSTTSSPTPSTLPPSPSPSSPSTSSESGYPGYHSVRPPPNNQITRTLSGNTSRAIRIETVVALPTRTT
ncbi:hypothetical protein HanHA300_Chr09g0312601 [Helianthus annuus]|nr:hypothetical protein HanHA300_Chr09g0312601 [Helianthus annuus]